MPFKCARFKDAFALTVFQMLISTPDVHGSCCNLKCNPRAATVGCIGFDMSDPQQCIGVVCPEVHVESCTNPCRMTTQAFSVPKSCCCAPYCTLPGPQTICTTQPICKSNCGQDAYRSSCDCSRAQPLRPHPLPPQQRYGCYMPMPYPYPPQMSQPAAPSYCVQSVVVGGKAVTPEKGGGESGGGHQEGGGGPVGGNPGNRTGSGGPPSGGPLGGPSLGGVPGRPAGLGLDPSNLRLRDPRLGLGGGGGGGGLGPLLRALPSLLGGLRIPGLGGLGEGASKYEGYLEKILDAIHDKLEPDCVGPSPMVVMPQTCGCSCSPRVRVKKIRRKQRRKYMIESCEEPDVVVEEEEEHPSYVLAAPFCPARSCCCRARRCGCRSCCC